MGRPLKGVINIYVRESIPDWEPREQPKAPEGAPNVLDVKIEAAPDPTRTSP